MTQLTVFLVLHGETKLEANADVGSPEVRKPRLHEILDPSMTERGYRQAQHVFISLIQGICDATPVPSDRGDKDDDGVVDPLRNLALFSAPLRACQASALMLTAAGLASQDKLTWRYTTIHAATSPSAVPVITCNDLCRQVPEIQNCGGIDQVVDAGLLHTAAAPWNDKRNKSPFMQVVVEEMKGTAQQFVKEWKADRTINPPRRVLDCQFLRLDDVNDPWSLEPLTSKINICINMLERKSYLPPPRRGRLSTKLNVDETVTKLELSPSAAVKDCVWKARQVGCDTVLFTLPAACIDCVLQETRAPLHSKVSGPCTVVSLIAIVNDTNGDIDWKLHGTYSHDDLLSNDPTTSIPPFAGMVDCLVPPPPDKDPASVPANQWSKFPPPQPENIPPDYPDLPPFSLALESPVPTVTMSYRSHDQPDTPHDSTVNDGGMSTTKQQPTARGTPNMVSPPTSPTQRQPNQTTSKKPRTSNKGKKTAVNLS